MRAMFRPRLPPLQLTTLPPTPPATPDKLQHHLTSTSPNQTAWTPREPKSVRFALPSAQTQGHKSKSSKTATSKTHHSQKTKAQTRKIPAKPYSASLNRLITRYYALVQPLCEPELASSRFNVVNDKFVSESRGILAPPPSPVSPVSPVRDLQVQIQQRKTLQALRNHAHTSIYKPLTAIAPVLTLPLLPSQEAEKEVRRVLKRAKRGLKVLEGLVTSGGLELELDLNLDQKMGMEMDLDRGLANDGSGNRMDIDLDGSGSADMHNLGTGGRLGASKCRRDSQKMMAKEREMEAIQEGVAMMSLEETRGLPHLRVSGRKAEGLSSARLCGTGANWGSFQGEAYDDIVGREEQAQEEAVLTGLGGLMSI